MAIGAKKQDNRRQKLIDEITQNPSVLIRDLAQKFGVSRETIRRDFDILSKAGHVDRRYGGVILHSSENLISFESRQEKNISERRAIANKALGLLAENQVIMLGPGTSALLFALELAQINKPLTIITNGVREALALVKNDSLKVILAPGSIDHLEGFTWGHETTDFLSNFNADLTIFFADGLTVHGASEADSRTVWTIKMMLQQSEQNMLLIDHFRFERQGVHNLCQLNQLDNIISDRRPDSNLYESLLEKRINFYCV